MTLGGAVDPFLFGLTVERSSFTTAWLIASTLILMAAAVAAASELQLRPGPDISTPSSPDSGTNWA